MTNQTEYFVCPNCRNEIGKKLKNKKKVYCVYCEEYVEPIVVK